MDLDATIHLPQSVKAVIKEVLAVQLHIIKTSVRHLDLQTGDLPSIYFLGNMELVWHFFLAAAGESRILLFYRTKGVERLLLCAKIFLRLTPASSAEFDAVEPTGLRISLVIPPFVVQRVNDMIRPGGVPPYGPKDELLVLAVGLDRLSRIAAVFPKGKREKIQLYYSPAVNAPYERIIPDSHNGSWPLRPFEDLFLTVHSWVERGFENAGDIPVHTLSLGPKGSHLSTIASVVEHSFRELRQTISKAARNTITGIPSHDLEAFLAEIILRTRADGNLATKDEDDPFHMLLSFRWQSYGDADHLRVAIGPPDFLVSGDLKKSFMDCMRSDEFKEPVKDYLIKNEWPSHRISLFLEDMHSAVLSGNCTVVRVNRRREVDTNIIVIQRRPGIRGWIFAADFVLSPIDSLGKRRVKMDGNLRVLYEGDSKVDTVGELFVKYFEWLCAEIHQWTKVLK